MMLPMSSVGKKPLGIAEQDGRQDEGAQRDQEHKAWHRQRAQLEQHARASVVAPIEGRSSKVGFS